MLPSKSAVLLRHIGAPPLMPSASGILHVGRRAAVQQHHPLPRRDCRPSPTPQHKKPATLAQRWLRAPSVAARILYNAPDHRPLRPPVLSAHAPQIAAQNTQPGFRKVCAILKPHAPEVSVTPLLRSVLLCGPVIRQMYDRCRYYILWSANVGRSSINNLCPASLHKAQVHLFCTVARNVRTRLADFLSRRGRCHRLA